MFSPTKIAAIAGLHARIDGLDGLARATVFAVIKDGARQSTFAVDCAGRRMIIKAFHGQGAEETVARAQAELTRLEVTMSAGPYQVNRCIAAYPERGLIALSFVDGTRVHDLLKTAGPQDRAALIEGSGRWLDHLCGHNRSTSGFAPARWLAKRRAADLSGVDAADRAELARLLDWMADAVPALKGFGLRKAPTHGDFVSINLMKAGPVFFGVEIQGLPTLPVARDVARFLVWVQLKTPLYGAYLSHGIAVADLYACLRSNVLDEEETRRVLPFFLAEQLFGRTLELARLGADMSVARNSIDNLVCATLP